MQSPCGTIRTKEKIWNINVDVDDNWLTFIVFSRSAARTNVRSSFAPFFPGHLCRRQRARTHKVIIQQHPTKICTVPQGGCIRPWRIAHIWPNHIDTQEAKSILFHFYWRPVCCIFCSAIRICHLIELKTNGVEAKGGGAHIFVDCLINLSVTSFIWLYKNQLLNQNSE